MKKVVRELAEYAEAHGFRFDHVGKHYVYKHANGHCLAISRTPGDKRGGLNKQAEIRRASKLTKEK